MQVAREGIIDVLYLAIDELNQGLAPDARIDKSPQTPLFGDGASLDSLGLVNLVLTAEQKLSVAFDTQLTLAQSLLSEEGANPPATVGALADFITALLEEVPDA